MVDAWQILRDAGVPIAGERFQRRHDRAELAAATRTAIAGAKGREAEALAAFVLAWHQHWPSAFAAAFPGDAERITDWASRQFSDDNRYVKLRRIALANLAHVL